MRVVHLRPTDYHVMPWRNGQGSTTEIAVEYGGTPDRFLWRLSMAGVSVSGPFSDFAGYDRTLMLLDGGGMTLHFGENGSAHLEKPGDMASFSGDWATESLLTDGPIHDLNAIVDRARADHRVAVRHGNDHPGMVADGATTLLFALQRSTQLTLMGGGAYTVAAGETLCIDGPADYRFSTTACAVVEILPR